MHPLTLSSVAKAVGGEVYFWDESGFRADTVHGKTWGKKGETPVIPRPGQRQLISAASAVNSPIRVPSSAIHPPRLPETTGVRRVGETETLGFASVRK